MKTITSKLVKVITSITLAFSCFTSLSQEVPVQEIENLQVDETLYVKQVVSQTNNQKSEVIDNNTQQYLNNNFSEILQSGNNNEARVFINGSNNYSGVLQNGSENELELTTFGNFNSILIEQYGDNNYTEKLTNGDFGDFHLEQRGVNNNVTIEKNLPPGTEIMQNGNAMKIIIR